MRLHSALARHSTRVRLMKSDDSSGRSNHLALSLYTQDEAEHAEDTSRHSWLQWLEHNIDDVTAMGKKEDQILAAVKRIFRDGGKVREKVQMLCDKVEKLELRSLEDRQKGEDRNIMQRHALTKTLTSPGNLQRHISGPARADPNTASTDRKPSSTLTPPSALAAEYAPPALSP